MSNTGEDIYVRLAKWAYDFLRKRDALRKIYSAIKKQSIGETLWLLNYDGILPTQKFAFEFLQAGEDVYEKTRTHAGELTTCYRRVMGAYLGLPPAQLNCCLEFFLAAQKSDEDLVCTWGRSEPLDGRPSAMRSL
ncbi:MAG: hypothetical protein ACREX4_07305 [Gammaproteobacteria bacterium]